MRLRNFVTAGKKRLRLGEIMHVAQSHLKVAAALMIDTRKITSKIIFHSYCLGIYLKLYYNDLCMWINVDVCEVLDTLECDVIL